MGGGGEERVIRTEHREKKTPVRRPTFRPLSYFTCGFKKNGSLVVYNKLFGDIFENVICFMQYLQRLFCACCYRETI